MSQAKAIQNAIEVINAYPFEGYHWVEVPCPDYDVLKDLPPALSYEDRVYGRTGWNSDRGLAYYSTRKTFATAIYEG